MIEATEVKDAPAQAAVAQTTAVDAETVAEEETATEDISEDPEPAPTPPPSRGKTSTELVDLEKFGPKSGDVVLTSDAWKSQTQFRYLTGLAHFYSRMDFCPRAFKNKPNETLVALELANRLGIPPMAALQNFYTPSDGKLGMSAQFAISLANTSRVFKKRIRFKTQDTGKFLFDETREKAQKLRDMSVTAYATLADGDEVDATVSMLMAYGEGWTNRSQKAPNKPSKYETMPEHMLRNRAAMFLIRLYAPDVILGMQSDEELIDTLESDAIDAEHVPEDAAPPPRKQDARSRLAERFGG